MIKVAKRLKKEKVNVDIVSFGEEVSAFTPSMPVMFSSRVLFRFDDGIDLLNASGSISLVFLPTLFYVGVFG